MAKVLTTERYFWHLVLQIEDVDMMEQKGIYTASDANARRKHLKNVADQLNIDYAAAVIEVPTLREKIAEDTVL